MEPNLKRGKSATLPPNAAGIRVDALNPVSKRKHPLLPIQLGLLTAYTHPYTPNTLYLPPHSLTTTLTIQE